VLGLSPHHHSAKLTAHHHTSYGGLLIVLGLTGLFTLLLTLGGILPSNADSGSIGVTGVVPGAPPSSAPVITAPDDGTTVTTHQITVSGSCSGTYTVVVTVNGVVRGSAFCDHDGRFSLVISLNAGKNAITAHYVDNLNQSGPPSNTVNVTYKPVAPTTPVAAATGSKVIPSPGAPAAGSGNELTITAPYRFDNAHPGDSFNLTGTISGGTGPYALEIDWGDSTQTLLSRVNAGSFEVAHTYSKAGRYVIRLSVSDVTNATAFFQTALTVSGPTVATPTQPATPPIVVPPYQLMIIWPLFLITCLVALSFWLGERYDRRHYSPPPAA
jgi:hypothetical protein